MFWFLIYKWAFFLQHFSKNLCVQTSSLLELPENSLTSVMDSNLHGSGKEVTLLKTTFHISFAFHYGIDLKQLKTHKAAAIATKPTNLCSKPFENRPNVEEWLNP